MHVALMAMPQMGETPIIFDTFSTPLEHGRHQTLMVYEGLVQLNLAVFLMLPQVMNWLLTSTYPTFVLVHICSMGLRSGLINGHGLLPNMLVFLLYPSFYHSNNSPYFCVSFQPRTILTRTNCPKRKQYDFGYFHYLNVREENLL